MTGLAHPPDTWDAETAKPGAGNTGLAASPERLVNSQRKHPAMRSVRGLKDGCCVAARQERSWWGASALRWESEMATRSEDNFLQEFADDAADFVRVKFLDTCKRFSARCESPIERVMAAALIHCFKYGSDGFFGGDGPWFGWDDRVWSDPVAFPGCHIWPQTQVGIYRADFFIAWEVETHRGPVKRGNFVIECDGHDHHERTKEQAAHDRRRDRWMTEQGITVIRFTGSEIWANPSSCAQSVMDIMWRAMGWMEGVEE